MSILVPVLNVVDYSSIYLSQGTDGFHYFTLAKSARAHISVHVLWCKTVRVSLGWIPSGGVSGLQGTYIFSLSRSCQNLFIFYLYLFFNIYIKISWRIVQQ